LGVSVAAVDQRLHRAKNRLAAEYEGIAEPRSWPAAEGGVS
jgi:DNA-directed RNA polymerase specialized sigma24 family protein